MKNFLLNIALLLLASIAHAQVLSLDSCRTLAIENNKDLQKATLQKEAADWQRKAALTNYLPKVSAIGTYQFTSRELSILNDNQKDKLGIIDQLLGTNIVDAFRTDTRNIFGATVMLAQPVYMGGKIIAYDHITKFAQQIAEQKHDMALQDLIVGVDEAYWRIVSLQAKKELAHSFRNLIQKLNDDVEKLVAEGLATKADQLSVQVKLNEADLAVIQVENGLKLSRMALAQLCGMPMDSEYVLLDETTPVDGKVVTYNEMSDTSYVDQALANRPELQALDLASKIRREQVKVARSEYLPHLALTGGYLATSPSLYNGFEKKFQGMWNVGVTLNIPILTWGERIYKVKQAKVEAQIAETEAEEVREKITLQVNQNQQKLQEARERLNASLRSQAQADENVRIASLGLQEGVIPVTNVLQAQTAWLLAHSTVVEAEVDLRLADTYLSRSLGTIK